MGAKVARSLAKRSLESGHKPEQSNMERPLDIQGVGHGSQQCQWQMNCPIAITNEAGEAKLHKLTAPIVEGRGGEDLPGLLGLRSLEHERAILDCGNRMLHLVGQGEVQLTLPPGSVSIPLKKAPSGHLVMVVDDFEGVTKVKGGVQEASLQLHSSLETAAASPNQPAARKVTFNV